MLVRLLIIVALIWLVTALIKRACRRNPPKAPRSLTMARCARCSLGFPQSEAIVRNGQPYCSPECADRASHD